MDELNRGVRVPTVEIVCFTHRGINLSWKIEKPRKNCINYVARLFSTIDSAMAQNKLACHTPKNILYKANTLNNDVREKKLHRLQLQERLSN